MQTEIEAKFANTDHDLIRKKLQELGARCEQPMRLMRRKLFDYPDRRFDKSQSQRLRVRDEGHSTTFTYKSKSDTKYAHEVETTVGSFDTMCQLFEAIGLISYSYQESKREAWHYKNVEVVLDEWPWLNPYIEIEGSDEASIQQVAAELGFDWRDALFETVDTVYQQQYSGMKPHESIGIVSEVRFNTPLPDFLKERQ